jgi:hypothetical protein
MPTHAGLFGRRTHYKAACSELSGLSIYQPGEKPGQGEFPCFFGFCACFLESNLETDALLVYVLRFTAVVCLLVVVLAERMLDDTLGR